MTTGNAAEFISNKIGNITGQTRLAGLFGYPARYSLSPQLHNAAYEALGIDAKYLVFPVLPRNIPAAVESIRALELVGVSVTIPHKDAVVACVDSCSPEATKLNAVNTICLQSDRLIGHNTDGIGMVAALKYELNWTPLGKKCVVIGAGGSARAIALAFVNAGASEILIVNRSQERGKELAAMLGKTASYINENTNKEENQEVLRNCDLIVNSTPLGSEGDYLGVLPISPKFISKNQIVVDVVYKPFQTAFLKAASEVGAVTMNGLPMLVHQAAEQIRLWFEVEAPIEEMYKSVKMVHKD